MPLPLVLAPIAGKVLGTAASALASKAIGSIGKNGAQGESKGSGMSAQSALGGGAGILQNLQAMKLKNKAESAMPGFVDPNQSAFLAELAQKRKSIDTGSDVVAPINAIDATNAGTNEAIVRSTGGDVGGTIQALLQSQGMANQAKNNALAQSQQRQAQYTQMYGALANRVEDRKLQLEMYRSQQARAEWAKMRQKANQNMMAGLGRAAQQDSSQQGDAVGGSGAAAPTSAVDLSVLQNKVTDINAQPIDDAGLNMGQIA
jgi:hypothetical protein